MEIKQLIESVPWHHKFEIEPGIVTPGVYAPKGLFQRLRLPNDMSGLRVIDIGARDGYFSFEMEKRGAEVLAVDYCPSKEMGFDVAKQILGSSVQFLQANLYELPNCDLEKFDIVLCLGVIYHVPDPYLTFEILRALVKGGGKVFLESNNLDAGFRSVDGEEVEFPNEFSQYPTAIFTRANPTNYWCMNYKCLKALAEDTAFEVIRQETWGKRILMEMTAVNDSKKDGIMKLARGKNLSGLRQKK